MAPSVRHLPISALPAGESSGASHLRGELLQPADVDGPLLGGTEVAAAHTQVGGGAHHPTGQAEGVVREYHLGGSIVVLPK